MPKEDYRHSKEAVWLYLDRANLSFFACQSERAVEDYQRAIEAMDYYQIDLLREELSSLLLSEELKAYAGEDFEQIFARLYAAFALAQLKDWSNVHALLRQAEEEQQRKKELYRQAKATERYQIEEPLAKYLFALLLEKRGELSNATILYREARELFAQRGQLIAARQVEEDLKQMEQSKREGKATLLLFLHQGAIGRKISVLQPMTGMALQIAEQILGSRESLTLSNLPGIAIPKWEERKQLSFPTLSFSFLGQEHPFILAASLDQLARLQLKKKIPLLAARALIRLLLRRGALQIVREREERGEEREEGRLTLSFLTDLFFLSSNLFTHADTRSWRILPKELHFIRLDLPEGCYTLSPPPFSHEREQEIVLGKHQLFFVHWVTFSPQSVFSLPSSLPKGECA